MKTNSRKHLGEDSGGMAPKSGSTDRRLVEALHEYMRDLENGRKPDLEAMQARHPEIANSLVACMEGIDIVNAASRALVFANPAAALQTVRMNCCPHPAPPGRWAIFIIVRQIGRGGMGIVYEAQQLSLDRRVALKVLPFAAAMDPRHLQRFKNEAQAAAHLHHTNIVPIFGVGCERGVHYYAMPHSSRAARWPR